MSLDSFTHPRLCLQYRRSWADPWTWDTGTIGVSGPFMKGGGNVVGNATFYSYDTDAANREAGAKACPLRRGWFVRIVSKSRTTQVQDGQSTSVPDKVYWTGWLAKDERVTRGRNPSTTSPSSINLVQWSGLGLAGLLACVDLHRVWRGCGTSDAGIRALESALCFGADRRPDNENRAAKRILYPRNGWGTWNLLDLLTAILDWSLYIPGPTGTKTKRFPHWPDFVLSGQTEALGMQVQDASLGGDLASALVAILNPRRGLFFSALEPQLSEKASDPVKIDVRTFARDDLSVPQPVGAATVIPKNPLTVDLVVGVPHRALTWAPPPTPRMLTLHGRRDVRIASLRWSRTGGTEDGALARGWNPADDSKAGDTAAQYGPVFSTWTIRQGWDGSVKGTVAGVLPHVPAVSGTLAAPDSLHGAGGLTGAAQAPTSEAFPEFGIEFLSQMPLPDRATNASEELKPITDWLAATAGVVLDQRGSPLRPMVFVHHRSKGTWERVNIQITFPDALTVVLGTGPKDAARLRALLSTDQDDLVVTCAFAMPSALAVSYIPPVPATADVLIGADRGLRMDQFERITVQAGTVFGLSSGTPTAPTVDRVVRDDVGLLRSVLALARLSGERSAGGVYEDTAQMDTGYRPGQMVAQASLADGVYQDIGYLITSVTYNGDEGDQPKTTLQIDTAAIDMEII